MSLSVEQSVSRNIESGTYARRFKMSCFISTEKWNCYAKSQYSRCSVSITGNRKDYSLKMRLEKKIQNSEVKIKQ